MGLFHRVHNADKPETPTLVRTGKMNANYKKAAKTRVPAVVVVVVLCISVLGYATPGHSREPTVGDARALVGAGKFGGALSALRPMDLAGADRHEILFLRGLAAIGASQTTGSAERREALLDEAIAALRLILISKPGLVRVRLELARAFFFKGDDELARAHFERVLAARPPAPVVANIRAFLEKIRARRRWTTYLGAAIAPDSNVGAASDSEIIYIFGLPFRRDEFAGETSGIGISIWGGGEYQYPLSERLRWRLGAKANHREYAGSGFDRTTIGLHHGPRWLIGPSSEASALVNVDQRWSSTSISSRSAGLRLEASHRFSPRVAASALASWQRNSYHYTEYLDGPGFAISGRGAWVVTPTVRFDGAAGVDWQRTRVDRWGSNTPWLRVGVRKALGWGFTVGGTAELRWADYRAGDWFPFVSDGSARKDRTRVLRVSVLNRALTWFGFSPQLVLVNEARTSNGQLYDYRRNRAELLFQREF